jgi:hypothetical protein
MGRQQQRVGDVMRKWLLLAAYPAFIAVVLAVVAIANGALDPNDATHAVVIRNEALIPVRVRLLDRSENAAFYEIPPQSEATVTPPATSRSLHEVAALDAGCAATGVVGFDGSGHRWSDMSMLVVQADGTLGYLTPPSLAIWQETRTPLPAADPLPVAGCVEP